MLAFMSESSGWEEKENVTLESFVIFHNPL